jgi:hypothetical protein
VATRLIFLMLERFPLGERVLLVLDDSPSKRFGPHVQGADIHRMRAMLYVRRKTMASIPRFRGWKFATKLQLAARLVEWSAPLLKEAGKRVWVVVDGGYTKRPFLRRTLVAKVTVVGRLRKDAALRTMVAPRRGGRGRPRKYDTAKISLAKRARQRRGWQALECTLYRKTVTKLYKTFLATYTPVGGAIRVVLVEEDHGWHALFSTDIHVSVQEILEAFADRATIEQDFHDIKEVWDAGQQQVRNIWTNAAVYHLNLWMHTLVELWSWEQEHEAICDRSDSPWDDPDRRPSHANRRNVLRRDIQRHELSAITVARRLPRKIILLAEQIMNLAS